MLKSCGIGSTIWRILGLKKGAGPYEPIMQYTMKISSKIQDILIIIRDFTWYASKQFWDEVRHKLTWHFLHETRLRDAPAFAHFSALDGYLEIYSLVLGQVVASDEYHHNERRQEFVEPKEVFPLLELHLDFEDFYLDICGS